MIGKNEFQRDIQVFFLKSKHLEEEGGKIRVPKNPSSAWLQAHTNTNTQKKVCLENSAIVNLGRKLFVFVFVVAQRVLCVYLYLYFSTR